MLQNRPPKTDVKIHAHLHRLVSQHCERLGRTVSEWVEDAVTEKLDREWPGQRGGAEGKT